MAVLRVPNGSIGVIGGTEVFALFLDRYDTFYLTRAPGVQIPGGRPVFPEVPRIVPEDVLSQHGVEPRGASGSGCQEWPSRCRVVPNLNRIGRLLSRGFTVLWRYGFIL
jgi:hypothetical protein